MNQIISQKINLLTDKLAQLESKLLHSSIQRIDQDCRALIDERRQLLADIIEEQKTTQTENIHSTGSSIVDQLIDALNSRSLRENCACLDFEHADFCNSFLDQSIPKVWDFSKDVMILVSPCSTHLMETASKRGQKHIIAYFDTDEIVDDCFTKNQIQNLYVCKSAGDIKRVFTLIQTSVGRTVVLPASQNAELTSDKRTFLAEAVSSGQKNKFENTRAATKFGQQWARNILINMPRAAQGYNLHEVSSNGNDVAIIVASGPSLDKNIELLAEIQDKVVIVTALRSVPVLNAAGIKPDIVVQLDAETDEVASKLAHDNLAEIENYVYEPFISPGFLNIPAKNHIWSLSSHFYDIHQKFGTQPTPFNVPSVSIYGLHLCQHIGIKNLCFIGQDLAASGEKQYATGATNLLPANSKLSMFNVEVPGFYGTAVKTRSSFAYQIQICSDIAEIWSKTHPEVELFNATEGGAYIEGFSHLTLREFSKKFALQERATKTPILLETKNEISNSLINEFLASYENGMRQITKLADKISRLDRVTDKTRGLDKKIKKEIEKFSLINAKFSLLQTSMQDEIAMVAGTSEKGKATSSYSDFFSSVKKHAVELRKACNQAKFE